MVLSNLCIWKGSIKNKGTYPDRIKTVAIVLPAVPQLQPERPYAGANAEGYEVEGWERTVTRKPVAPPNFALSCPCLPSSHFLPPNPTNYQARRVLSLRKRSFPRPVLSGVTWVARCRADTETVTPQSRQGWRWRASSEHAWGREPKLLQKRRERRGRWKKKSNQDLT